MRCNNHDDLLQVSFTSLNIFGGLYITQSNIYDRAFIAKIVSREVYSEKCSITDACSTSICASAF